MKKNALRLFTFSQFAAIFLFILLILGNDIIDLPHYVFNDTLTSYSQRFYEIVIEISIFVLVIVIHFLVFRKLYKRIRFLEGLIPICANCKKIRNKENHWEQIEIYITQHSLAHFSHGICPDCAKRLYPGLNNT